MNGFGETAFGAETTTGVLATGRFWRKGDIQC
jgi:hypothetical protein